jgi:hypothetical protein
MYFEDIDRPNVRKDDRILVLRVQEGKKPLNSTGTADPRIFKGENSLHALLDPRGTNLWTMRFEKGITPEPLKKKFTRFELLLNYAKGYFAKRNVDIVEVID